VCPKKVGDAVVNRDYGQTLRAIAKGGADVFYSGEIAKAIDEDMRKNDALLSIEDLKAWKTARNPPLWGDYRGYRVSTNQPPGGGVMLIEMLNILENFDIGALEHGSAEHLRIVVEAMKRATIDKDLKVGDPKFVTVPVDELTSKAYAKTMAGEIMRGVKAEVPRFNTGNVSKDTTHISVLDKDGNCFTMTHSLGMPSGVITPGLGFMYNGCMGVFDPRPGRAGSIAPGKARFSSVVPSIIFKDGKPHLIIGAPGATQIAMGVLHVILNALDFDMTMVEAVSAPRFSATSDTIDISNRIQGRVERELKGHGYPVVRSPYGFGFAAVHAIRIHEDGLDGGADPGHDGVVIAV
jgi:gamma-glutamyltranspeptidase/glutathione hydrolase